MKSICDFASPQEAIETFENMLSEFTGAPGVVVTDSCTHAIELGIRYKMPSMYASIPSHTYLGIPMTLAKLGVDWMYDDAEWEKMYQINGTKVWDSALYFEQGMFQRDPGRTKLVCVSFGYGSPLDIGHGGAILTDDKEAARWLKIASQEGRDLEQYPNSADQKVFQIGYRYGMRPEDAVIGINKLEMTTIPPYKGEGYKNYPSLRSVEIVR